MSPHQPPRKGTPGLPGAESRLFAHYGVEPRARTLALQAPPVTVGIREAGSGEPGLLMHGVTPRFGLVTGGHEPWLDDLDGCAKLITEFLAGVPVHRHAGP